MRMLVVTSVLAGCVGPSVFVDKSGDGDGTVMSDPEGIECGDACGAIHSGLVTLTATPKASSDFLGWDGACTGDGPCGLDVLENTLVTAHFELKSFELTTTTMEGGSIVSEPVGIVCGDDCTESYKYATRITLLPTTEPGFTFMGWTGADECPGLGRCEITLIEPRIVGAVFARNQLLSVTRTNTGSGNGGVYSMPAGIDCSAGNLGPGVPQCTADFVPGTQVTLAAEPDAMSSFVGWSGDCSGGGTCTVTMDVARRVTATFGPKPPVPLTITIAGTGGGTVTSNPTGISCPSDCSHGYPEGTQITLFVFPDGGSTFSGWTGGGCMGFGQCTTTIATATSITATFTAN